MKLHIGGHSISTDSGWEPLIVALGGKFDEAPPIAMMPTAKASIVRRNIVVAVEPKSGDFAAWVDGQRRLQANAEKAATPLGEEQITTPAGKGLLIKMQAPTLRASRVQVMQAYIDAGAWFVNVRASHLDDRKVNADAGPEIRKLIGDIKVEA